MDKLPIWSRTGDCEGVQNTMMKSASRRNSAGARPPTDLALDCGLFAPGDRVCVAVSGGADSTALLRSLLARRAESGLVLSVLHVEHGLRGETAARDAKFVAALARNFDLPFEVHAVDTLARVAEQKESIEEAARNLRYEIFRRTLASGKVDKVATAHTLDDQAETVLMKLLRGAWTEGLSGIHPVLRLAGEAVGEEACHGVCVRPLLGVPRAEIEAYLRGLDQPWCEDETNRSPRHTRNRVRHELLPALGEYNPQIAQMLAHMAANARAEEEHWRAELARVMPLLLLPGKPVRGGGRSVGTGAASVAIELARLQALDAGLRRRVLRAAAEGLGARVDFEATERMLEMIEARKPAAATPAAGERGLAREKRLELPRGVRVERSARELQFERVGVAGRERVSAGKGEKAASYELLIPGTVGAPVLGARYTARFEMAGLEMAGAPDRDDWPDACKIAEVRAWRPGDRVELAHSRGPKKVKEVLERMGIRGEERALWPVVVWQGQVVWMRGVEVAGGADAKAVLRIVESRF